MKLPGKDTLKKAFMVAAASVGIASMSGCAIAVRPVGVYVPPPARVYVEPAYVYPVAPIVVVPAHRHWR